LTLFRSVLVIKASSLEFGLEQVARIK